MADGGNASWRATKARSCFPAARDPFGDGQEGAARRPTVLVVPDGVVAAVVPKLELEGGAAHDLCNKQV